MPDAERQQDIKRFDGGFLVWKLSSSGFARKVARTKLPWRFFATLEDAIEVAADLNRQHPDSTFVVIQEVARVKMVDAAAAEAVA